MPSTVYLLSLFLTFVRVLAVLMTAPIFSSQNVPAIAKIGFAGMLSLVLLPVETPSASLATWPTELLPFVLVVAQEVMIGVLIGFVSNLIFVAVGMAASIMGLQIGFRAANLVDPFTATPTSALEQFYTLLAAALFLTINGHHWLITALARTFEVAPLGTFVLKSITVGRLIAFSGETFVAATRIALPVAGTLLLADLGLGLVARAVPHIQVFFLDLPLKMGLGFLALALTLALTLPFVRDLFAGMPANISAISKP
jgi:flagellar biosynthetic protein FliR